MSARFAEKLDRPDPLKLVDFEIGTFHRNQRRPSQKDVLTCQQDIFIGVFFDGTGNNKYRDAGSLSCSNVARLYEVYAGSVFYGQYPLLKGMKAHQDPTPARRCRLPAVRKRLNHKPYAVGECGLASNVGRNGKERTCAG